MDLTSTSSRSLYFGGNDETYIKGEYECKKNVFEAYDVSGTSNI